MILDKSEKWELSETGGECNNQKCHVNLYNQNRFQGHDSLALGQLTTRKLISVLQMKSSMGSLKELPKLTELTLWKCQICEIHI